MDRYKQGYIEETLDLLVEMESALLRLDEKRDDLDAVGRAFRALHTIKGSGAMFGFDDIVRFTHDLETAFDKLRNGQLAATPELIKLTLAAGDQIKAMLEEADGRNVADKGRSAQILSDLRQLTGTQEAEQTVATSSPVVPQVSDQDSIRDWKIYFKPGTDVFSTGANPLLLLRELRALGQLRVDADTSRIPSLSEMDPESCYLAWNMLLTTSETLNTIRDVFMFVEDDSELTIVPAAEQAAKAEKEIVSGNALEARPAGGTAVVTSLRVSAEKLDQLVNLVGELVTVQARLSEFAARRTIPNSWG